MWWTIAVALTLIALVWAYGRALPGRSGREWFLDYVEAPARVSAGPDGVAPEMAAVNAGPLLDGVLAPDVGLGNLTAGGCYAGDRTVEMELGGQYAQRTNNYRRDYPDNCSALRTEFVGSLYKPRDGVGLTVPCAGQCQFY